MHDLQPGRRSLRLKGVKLGAAKYAPLSGVRDLLPPFTPLYGVLGVFLLPYPGFGTCGPSHSPLYGVFGDPFQGLSSHPYPGFGVLVPGTLAPSSFLLTPIRGLGSWCQAPWPLQVTPTRDLRPLSGSCFFSPLSGVWDPGARHLGPFKSPLCGVLGPSLSPLFGVLLGHDEVVREPDILTVAEEWWEGVSGVQ